jgi:hypothetical protein
MWPPGSKPCSFWLGWSGAQAGTGFLEAPGDPNVQQTSNHKLERKGEKAKLGNAGGETFSLSLSPGYDLESHNFLNLSLGARMD